MLKAQSFAIGLNRARALTDRYPGLGGNNLEKKSESSIAQWLNKMKAGKPADRIPGHISMRKQCPLHVRLNGVYG